MVPGGFVGSALDAAKLILSSYVRALATTTPPRPTTPQAAVATHSGEKLTAGNPGRIFLVQQNSLKFDKRHSKSRQKIYVFSTDSKNSGRALGSATTTTMSLWFTRGRGV